MPLEDFIITVYGIVDDYFQKALCHEKLRKKGEAPALSDQEVITMEIVGEYTPFNWDYGYQNHTGLTNKGFIGLGDQ